MAMAASATTSRLISSCPSLLYVDDLTSADLELTRHRRRRFAVGQDQPSEDPEDECQEPDDREGRQGDLAQHEAEGDGRGDERRQTEQEQLHGLVDSHRTSFRLR